MKYLAVTLVLCLAGCGVSPDKIDNLKRRVSSLGTIAQTAGPRTDTQIARIQSSTSTICDDLESLK